MVWPQEEVWQQVIRTGAKDEPAFSFWLDLLNVPHEQTALVRQQALRVLAEHARDRTVIRNAFTSIALAEDERPAAEPGWAAAGQYLVQVVPHPTDPWEHAGDQAGWVIRFADQFAQDELDPLVANIWRKVADSFDMRWREPAAP